MLTTYAVFITNYYGIDSLCASTNDILGNDMYECRTVLSLIP